MSEIQPIETTTANPVVAATAAAADEKNSKKSAQPGEKAEKQEKKKGGGDGDKTAKEVAGSEKPVQKPEFVVSRKEFLAELSDLQSVVERKTTIPILTNILIEADGRELTMIATDLDLSLRTTCPAKITSKGSCTIPARKLYDYVRLLAEDDIKIKVLDNGHIQIKSGRSHTKMVGLARSNFPNVPLFPKENAVKLDAQMVRDLVAKSQFAVSKEESRYTLGGSLLLLTRDGATAVATDGHRMAYVEYRKGLELEKDTRILIPKKALSELASLLGSFEVEHIYFASDDSNIFFFVGGRLLASRQLTGTFPNYAAVLPDEKAPGIVIPTTDMLGALQRVSQFADQRSNSVRLHVRPNELKLASSNPEDGESEESIPIQYQGDALQLVFNNHYLQDFLKVVGTERVRLQFTTADKAAEMKPEGPATAGCNYRYVVMPMRV